MGRRFAGRNWTGRKESGGSALAKIAKSEERITS
jgi:hypothetical protein